MLYSHAGAIEFDDRNDVILVPHDDRFEVDNYTISLTFNADRVDGKFGIFSKDARNFGDGGHFTAYIDNGTLIVRFQSASESRTFTVPGIEANRDIDLVATYEDGRAEVFVDGELIGSAAIDASWETNTEAMQIGANGWASDAGDTDYVMPFDGTISDVEITTSSSSGDDNGAPRAGDDTVTTDAGIAVSFDPTANDTDPDGDALAVTAVTSAGNGSVELNDDGSILYTPDAGFSGTDRFDYTVSDGRGGTDTATVTVEVAAEPGTEPESNVLFSRSGDLELTGRGDVLVVPHQNRFAVDSYTVALTFNADRVDGRRGIFSKDARDFGEGGHVTAYIKDGTLIVRFQSANESRTFRLSGIEANRDIDLVATYADGRAEAYVDGQLIGSGAIDASWETNTEYMQIGANGWASDAGDAAFGMPFDGTISDVEITTASGAPASNGAPRAVDDAVTTDEGVAVAFDPTANDSDPDGDALAVASTTAPDHGTVELQSDGTLLYTPDAGFFGMDTFDYAVIDGRGGSDVGTVEVDVRAGAEPEPEPDPEPTPDPDPDPNPGPNPDPDASVVSTAAELAAALGAAGAGDTILLEPGNYGALTIDGRGFASTVTITSADASDRARFDSISITDSSNVTVDRVHVDNGGNGSVSAGLVTIGEGARHITLSNSEINGSVDGTYYGWRGFSVTNASDVSLVGNEIHDVNRGIVVLSANDVVVRDNDINYIGDDSMKFAAVNGVVIEDNIGARYLARSTDDAHLDFIQFQGSSSNIVVRGNVTMPAVNEMQQGIFFDDGSYSNVLVENNIVYNALGRGISISDGSGITVQYNTVLTDPDTGHKASFIAVPTGSVVQYNISSHVASMAGPSGSNLVVQWDEPNSPYYYNDVYENAARGFGLTIADLAPVPGSPGETIGAYERIAELTNSSTSIATFDSVGTVDDGVVGP